LNPRTPAVELAHIRAEGAVDVGALRELQLVLIETSRKMPEGL